MIPSDYGHTGPWCSMFLLKKVSSSICVNFLNGYCTRPTQTLTKLKPPIKVLWITTQRSSNLRYFTWHFFSLHIISKWKLIITLSHDQWQVSRLSLYNSSIHGPPRGHGEEERRRVRETCDCKGDVYVTCCGWVCCEVCLLARNPFSISSNLAKERSL